MENVMYFFKKKQKQFLDLRGDLILTHNPDLIKARTRNSGPKSVRNATYITDIPNLKPFRKLRATWAAIRFIWGPDQSFKPGVKKC